MPGVGGGSGQGLPGRNTGAQTGEVMRIGQLHQGAIAGRGGEQGGRAAALYGLRQSVETGPRREGGGGSGGGREDHQPTEPEGEGDGRGADDDIVLRQADDMVAEGVGHGEDVTMKMNAALGLAGGARGKGDQGGVIGGGFDGAEAEACRKGLGRPLQASGVHHPKQ